MKDHMMTINRQAGVTLIEAIVSLLIFSIGALGMAALQTTAIVQSDDSKQRSIATWKGQELVDRMLSSRTFTDQDGLMAEYAALIGSNAGGIASFGVDNDTFNCGNAVPTDCRAESCSALEFAAYDINDVLCDPATGLQSLDTNSDNDDDTTGSFGLSDMDLALRNTGDYYELYVAWQSRTATRNYADGDDDAANGITGDINTNLCGNTIALDARVDAICIRFQ